MPARVAPSKRAQLRRLRERGRYDAATIHAILDEGLVCHVGFVGADGPVVIPTAYARVDDRLYLHGAAGNAALRVAGSDAPVCVTVTLLDGLVLARSAFHHSLNYRSVVIFARGTVVTDREEQRAAATALVEHLVPGRDDDVRPPTDAELRVTKFVRLPIDEASAKVRAEGPNDEPEDLALPVWAGQLPLRLVPGTPVTDGRVPKGVRTPDYVKGYARPVGGTR